MDTAYGPMRDGIFCGFPLDFWLGLMSLLQSMYSSGYSRQDYAAYEEWFVLGHLADRGWDLKSIPIPPISK